MNQKAFVYNVYMGKNKAQRKREEYDIISSNAS
jgi:hypothetical protein